MAKAKSKTRKVSEQAKVITKEAQEKLQAALAEQNKAAKVAPIRQPIRITVGGQRMADGSLKNLATEDATSYAPVQPDQIKQYAGNRKTVNVGLTMNLMAGTQLPQEVLTKSSDCWSDRMLREDKRAFFYLVENANAELCRQAWEADLKERKRFDRPTLQALAKAVRHYKAAGKGERRISPFEKFARECLDVINNRTLTTEEILRNLRTMLEAKANLDQPKQEKQAAQA